MTLVETPEPITLSDDTTARMDQLRELMAGKEPEASKEETKTADTAAAESEVTENLTETKTEEVETAKTEEKSEEAEPELPKGVQKKIAKEVERQAEYDRMIAEAVSTTKAKEAELAKLTDKSGTEPAKPASATDGEPVFPDLKTFPGTIEEFTEALAKAQKEWTQWNAKTTRSTVQEELERQRQEDNAKAQWNAAVKEHGEGFSAKVEAVATSVPKEMQIAIRLQDSWDKLVVYLADNPAELKTLADEYASNPARTVAKLGRIEERLSKPPETTTTTTTVVPAKEPPPPLKKAPAGANTTGEFDWNKATMAQRRAWAVSQGALRG